MVINGPLIKSTALRVCNKEVAGIENESHVTKCVLSKLILSDRTQDTGHTINSGRPPPPVDMDSQQNGVPTKVLVISGKKANRAFREAWWTPPKVPHNETDLSQKPRSSEKADPQPDVDKKT